MLRQLFRIDEESDVPNVTEKPLSILDKEGKVYDHTIGQAVPVKTCVAQTNAFRTAGAETPFLDLFRFFFFLPELLFSPSPVACAGAAVEA